METATAQFLRADAEVLPALEVLMQVQTAEWLARIGYASRGFVYVFVAVFAFLAAVGSRSAPRGPKGALQPLLDHPLGEVLLVGIGAGLAFFAVWRILQSIFDADHRGIGRKAIARRTAYLGSAIVYGALSAWALLAAVGAGSRRDNSEALAHDWTETLMSLPFGRYMVAAIGLGFLIAAVLIARRGWRGEFQWKLSAYGTAREHVLWLGRVGFLARAFIFLVVGTFLIISAWNSNAREAHGLAGALRELLRQPYGWIGLIATAVGLLCYGCLQFALAWYRRIEIPSLETVTTQARKFASKH